MTKIFKNRIVIVILCSLLAFACLMMYSRSVKSEAEKVTVVRLTANIAKGEVVTEQAVETVEVGGFGMDKTVLKKKEDVVGKYAAVDLIKGDLLLPGKLSDNILSSTDLLEQLDGSRLAYSITIKEFANGLSDKLIRGDIVSMYIYRDGQPMLPPELTYVEVLAVTTAGGVDREDRVSTENGQSNFATVTVLVSPAQAMQLTGYEDSAEIHLALAYRGNPENAKEFLNKQNKILNPEGDAA